MGARNNRLLRFEMARIVRGRLLLALVAIFLMFAGVTFLLAPTLGGTYGLGRDTALVMMAYNSFFQFSMIVLGSVYAYAFSRDFQNGTYDFYPQLGISPARALMARFVSLLAISWAGTLLVYAAVAVAAGSVTRRPPSRSSPRCWRWPSSSRSPAWLQCGCATRCSPCLSSSFRSSSGASSTTAATAWPSRRTQTASPPS